MEYLSGGSLDDRLREVVRTGPGATVTDRVTTTTAQPAPPPPPTAEPLTTPSGGGKPSIAQRAPSGLSGSGEADEAYANYNVGTSLIHLGRCSDGLPYLDRSEAIQGHRSEISRDRASCKGK